MIALQIPAFVEDLHVHEVLDPARGDEAEVDVPRLRFLELMPVGGVCLVPLLETVKRMVGADESQGSQRVDQAPMVLADILFPKQTGSAIQIAQWSASRSGSSRR